MKVKQVKYGFLGLETIETWIVDVCHSENEWARQKFSVPCFKGKKPVSIFLISHLRVPQAGR
jgi:hypothetical protein